MILAHKEGSLRVSYEDRTGRCGEKYLRADTSSMQRIVKSRFYTHVEIFDANNQIVGGREYRDNVSIWWFDAESVAK